MMHRLPLADTASRITYEFDRLQEYGERWHYLALVVVCAAIAALVIWLYRRDSVELRPGLGMVLLALRLAALTGALVYYLDLTKRTERQLVQPSRVLVLVDTSLSMGLQDADSSSVPAGPNRLDQVVAVLDQGKLLDELRRKHEVVLLRFDTAADRVTSVLGKLPATAAAPNQAPNAAQAPAAAAVQWKTIAPRGIETRIGHCLRQVIDDEHAAPIAGIVVFSDGAQNAGLSATSAINAARDAEIPIFTVGVGSDRRPANVRVSDLVAPARAYPGDRFTVTGYIQAQEMRGRTATAELFSLEQENKQNATATLEASERITLAGNSEVVPVRFEIDPQAPSRKTFRLKIKAPADDSDPADNQQEVDVEIVDRKTKVLLIAGGPTREYTFLRNQLRRDKETIVDVWLQSARGNISQEANQLLTEMPSEPEQLFAYDCIVAFDANWRAVEQNSIDLLERWVSEKAGGLIVIAGPVETDAWVQEKRLSKLRAMYPVEFNRRLSLMEDARFGSTVAWPLEFTREGTEAEFLWLADSGPASQQTWNRFPGVYGHYAVRGPKPAATVYARYSDPEARVGDEQPVYMAGHFYGAGRVMYLGSGEMWRLRALDESYFEQFYTKLVRHVSQGRLLQGSSRGLLLVDRDRYPLGATVAIRAQLSDAQFEPLEARTVGLQLLQPDSTATSIELERDADRKGMYRGQFTALQEGTYRLALALPAGEEEQLIRRIQVRVPDLERANPVRNDALLGEIAAKTGARYYVGPQTVLGAANVPALTSLLKDRTETTYVAGLPDREFEETWMKSLLALICGALCLEWLIRRLSKLA